MSQIKNTYQRVIFFKRMVNMKDIDLLSIQYIQYSLKGKYSTPVMDFFRVCRIVVTAW